MFEYKADALVQCMRSNLVDASAMSEWGGRTADTQEVSDAALALLAEGGNEPRRDVTGLDAARPGGPVDSMAAKLFWAFVQDAWSAGELRLREVSWTLCTRGVHVIDYPDSTKWRGCFDDDLDHGPRSDGEERERVIVEMRKAVHYLAGGAVWTDRPKAKYSGPKYWD